MTRRRLLLSPLLLLVAFLTTRGLNLTSATASTGPETRVRAIDHVSAVSVGDSSGETPGGVAQCLRPETGPVVSGSCVAINTAGTTRVGRWMSEGEFDTMSSPGWVVEGSGGRTYVV